MLILGRVLLVINIIVAIILVNNQHSIHGQSSSIINSATSSDTVKKNDWKYWITKLSQLTSPNKVDEDPKQFQALWSLLNIARYILCKYSSRTTKFLNLMEVISLSFCFFHILNSSQQMLSYV